MVFLQDCYTDRNFPLSYIKLRDKNGLYVEASMAFLMSAAAYFWMCSRWMTTRTEPAERRSRT